MGREGSAGRRDTADIVIVGAGIAGISTAWAVLDRDPSLSVTLIDPRGPMSFTSHRPETNYRDWWPQPAMIALADRSIALIQRLLDDGESFAMDRRGYLYVAAEEATAATLPGSIERVRGAARDVASFGGGELLGPSELAARFPHLSPELRGGILVRRAGGVDGLALGHALLGRARDRGARVMRAAVRAIHLEHGAAMVRWSGADGEGRLSTERLVIAAGPMAGEVSRLMGFDLPVSMVLRQKVVIRDPAGVVPRDAPFTIGLDPVGDRPGGVHVKPDDTAGADALKLGWAWDQRPVAPADDPAVPPGFPSEVLDAATRFVPGLRRYPEATPVAHEGGFYARTPDGLPIIGCLPIDGVFAVAGFAGFGVMMGPAAGELAAEVILGSVPPAGTGGAAVGAFAFERFEEPGYLEDLRRGAVPTGEL